MNNNSDFVISSDPTLLQIDAIHNFLKQTHWAANRKRETIVKSIQNSLCFGVYHHGIQIAFARIVTDYCTFAYLCDVFVEEKFRGRGISKWIMEHVMAHPDLKNLRRFLLATKDAHTLYSRYGFQPINEEEKALLMGIRNDLAC